MSTTIEPTTTPHGHGHGADPDAPKTYALLAGFGTADDLVVATRKAAAAGYTLMDTHAPISDFG